MVRAWFTPFIEYARQFSDKGDAGVMALFLNLRSPLQLNETWRIGRPYLELLQKLYGDRANAIYKERYDAVAEKDKDILAEMPNEARRRQYIHRRIVTGEEVQQLLSQGYDGITLIKSSPLLVITANILKHQRFTSRRL